MIDKVLSREKCEIQFSCIEMFGFLSNLSFMMGQDAKTIYSNLQRHLSIYIKINYIGSHRDFNVQCQSSMDQVYRFQSFCITNGKLTAPTPDSEFSNRVLGLSISRLICNTK